jgi:MICOS complex subunit MIC60
LLQRTFADTRKPSNDSTPPVLPGSQSKTGAVPPPPGATASIPPVAQKTIPPSNVPLTPPPPGTTTPTSNPVTLPPTSTTTKALPPPKKPKRRFRRFILGLILLSGLGFSGGVWYSMVSDNFHDFFTEYVPFGEDAVLYFEEREFRRRFPRVLNATHRPSSDGSTITIPSNSGMSWKERNADGGSNLETKGRHMSAVEDNKSTTKSQSGTAKTAPATPAKKEAPPPEKATPSPAEKPAQKPAETKSNTPSAPASVKEESVTKPVKMPEVDEPSVFIPISRIDPLTINNADEPLVQDLVKMLNDIIVVINADNSTGKFTSSVNKAKNDLQNVGRRILELKQKEKEAAESKLKQTQGEFDVAAQELVRRLEREMRDQESRWRDEFESERKRIAETYEDRLKAEVEKSKQIIEEQQRNKLLEQAISLKQEFASAIKDRVENERDGRLAKLSTLSESINELEKLTSQWNSVLDANLKTQHLQVAVEAVRASLERTDRPKPFIKELAALKELASDNPVVDSAIAAINPSAYQLGIPTTGQLIDRFRRVSDEVRKASLLPEDAGLASHAASLVLSKVMFKKQGYAVGDDVESILTRTEMLLEEGNLDEAAREMNTLQGWAKTLSRDWLGEVRKVLEVRQALDVCSSTFHLTLLTGIGHIYRSSSSKSQGGLSSKCIIFVILSSRTYFIESTAYIITIELELFSKPLTSEVNASSLSRHYAML